MGKVNVFGWFAVGLMLGSLATAGLFGQIEWATVTALLAIACAILSHHD